MYWETKSYERLASPFSTDLPGYSKTSGWEDRTGDGPYISGKIVMVDLQPAYRDNEFRVELNKGKPHRHWEEINYEEFVKLPDELRAATPNEVKTIVQLRWMTRLEGRYAHEIKVGDRRVPVGGSALRILAELTVIDKERSAIVGRRTIAGGSPPSSSTGGETRYGSRPTDQIVSFIKGLPRSRGQ